MELLVTLTELKRIQRYQNAGVNGVIFGSAFSLKYKYSLDDIRVITGYCKEVGLKTYISMDAIICESDIPLLYQYLEFIKKLDIDGIYFSDFAIVNAARIYGLSDKLIYDPDTLMANSLDTTFILNNNIGVVLARELTLEEDKKILMNNPQKIDMQVFGHLKMSYSKRKFLSNYFAFIKNKKDFKNNKNIRIVEESRDYDLPIIEDEYGTRIYSDYIFAMFREFAELRKYVNRAIVDDTFISTDIVLDAISALRKITNENADFIIYYLKNKYKNELFSSGYLYEKTNKVKDE